MISIDPSKCIGCGQCVKDCFRRDLEISDGKARYINESCFSCFHCIAVCPAGAVSTDDCDMREAVPYDEVSFTLESERLLNFIKFRRSVRRFQDKPVEDEKLKKILEAGRFTATASNAQDVSYVVIREQLSQAKALALEALSDMGKEILADTSFDDKTLTTYASRWIQMHEEYLAQPEINDSLFFNAPLVVVALAANPINASLAASNMELMAFAQGLGCFYSGFFIRAAKKSRKLETLLAFPNRKEPVACLIIGYPDVRYHRTVPRKPAEIIWR